MDSLPKTNILECFATQSISTINGDESTIGGDRTKTGLDVNGLKTLDFLGEQASKGVLELEGGIVEEKAVLHLELFDVIFSVVHIYEAGFL